MILGTSRWCSGKEFACWCRRHKRLGFDPWVGKIPWSRKWQPTPLFSPGKFQGQKNLASYSPWGCKESDVHRHILYYFKDLIFPVKNNYDLVELSFSQHAPWRQRSSVLSLTTQRFHLLEETSSKTSLRDLLGDPVVKTVLPMQWVEVWSLVGLPW